MVARPADRILYTDATCKNAHTWCLCWNETTCRQPSKLAGAVPGKLGAVRNAAKQLGGLVFVLKRSAVKCRRTPQHSAQGRRTPQRHDCRRPDRTSKGSNCYPRLSRCLVVPLRAGEKTAVQDQCCTHRHICSLLLKPARHEALNMPVVEGVSAVRMRQQNVQAQKLLNLSFWQQLMSLISLDTLEREQRPEKQSIR